MIGLEKILAEHRDRRAFVYARQSSPAQVLHNRSSTERQIALAEVARELGWLATQIDVVDEDLGRSGRFVEGRQGFQRIATEMTMGRVQPRRVALGAIVGRLAPTSRDRGADEDPADRRTKRIRPKGSKRPTCSRDEGNDGRLRARLVASTHGGRSMAPGPQRAISRASSSGRLRP